MLKNIDRFRPSEYTAALIQALRADIARVQGTSVLEMGSGSGVVLAFLGKAGAKSLCGVDVEEEAIEVGSALLDELALTPIAELHRGNMWQPVLSRKFNLIVANLPHFATEHSYMSDRLSSWSVGGRDGRALLDPFLEGLQEHLQPDGRALMTHNAFADIDRSREILAKKNLQLQIVNTSLVCIPPSKMAMMSEQVLQSQKGRTIHCYGSHVFGDMHIVEITAQNKHWKNLANNAM